MSDLVGTQIVGFLMHRLISDDGESCDDSDTHALCSLQFLLIERRLNEIRYSCHSNMSLCMRKPTIWVSDQVHHKPACRVTEDG